MTAHAVIAEVIPAGREETFDLLHDYRRRLEWDTLLRRAYTVDDVPAGPGVEAVCQGRWHLGGLSFRTTYVTFRRPELAAVKLVGRVPFFASWAASIRHEPIPGADPSERHELRYTLTFSCRPKPLAPLIERIALAAFRWETHRRLRALARALA